MTQRFTANVAGVRGVALAVLSWAAALAAAVSPALARSAESLRVGEQTVRPFLAQHCYSRHDAKKA